MSPMTFGPGMSQAQPDICKVPPFSVPTPFPNTASNAMAVPTYYTVMILGQPELTIGSTYSVTSGDEAGAEGGVISGTFAGPGRFMQGSMVYYIGGQPSVRTTAPTLHNNGNCPGTAAVPSQTIKTVMS